MLDEDPTDHTLVKYTRKHLLGMFDALHQKNEFKHLSINDYPERTVPRGMQYKKRPRVDINNDSDRSIGESADKASDLKQDGQGSGLTVDDPDVADDN